MLIAVELYLHHQRHMGTEGTVDGKAHGAATAAAIPSTGRCCRGEDLGKARIVGEHLHTEGHGLQPDVPCQLVDKALGEEGCVAVRRRAPHAGRDRHGGGNMFDRNGRNRIRRKGAGYC